MAASMASARAFQTAGGGEPTNEPETGNRSTDKRRDARTRQRAPAAVGPMAAGGASPRASASAVKKRRPSSNASMPDGIELNQ